MHINCHAHIFNFPSVITQQSIQTLVNRLVELSPPVLAEDAIRRLVKDLMADRPAGAGSAEKLASWLKNFQASDTLAGFFRRAGASARNRLERANARLEALVDGRSLRETGIALDQLMAESDERDAVTRSLADFIDFVRIGFLPSIQAVADEMMDQTPADAGVVALTMDITRGDFFEAQFREQLEDTAAAAGRYPGRIFPFAAVNPNRSNHFAIMQDALTRLKFKGVKLYPSLGYDIDSKDMRAVYVYCQENGVPLLMHCNHGGFYYAKKYIPNSAPVHWEAILDDYPGLKICFGHFGGPKVFTKAGLPAQNTWAGRILKLMEEREGVFADVSYHDAPMAGGDLQANYFANLKTLLRKDTIKDRILFGTDFFLIRARLKDKNYWSYFEEHLGDDFDVIAARNPQRFLFS